MDINDFCKYGRIVIQCHDIPDADTIACGFALLRYIESQGGSARLVYSGRAKITKPSLLWMLTLLKIPLEYVHDIADCDLLVTVDCQYGAGNVKKFAVPQFAVIDHHRLEIPDGENIFVRPSLGSCATLVWDLLKRQGFDFKANPDVYTALYYGLYADTNSFAEMSHPLDRDLAEFMPHDRGLIKKLKGCALTVAELQVVADTLYIPRTIGNVGLLKAQPCDPNILGFTSDIAQQVEQFDCCVVYCLLENGIKLSIRSAVREIMAHEMADFIAAQAGSGGGNTEKAGGFLSFEKIKALAPSMEPEEYLIKRIEAYNANYDLIYASSHSLDFAAMPQYQKLCIQVGFALITDLFEEGTPISIRTLEGDIDTVASADIYIMIGLSGEVYPIKKAKFELGYKTQNAAYNMDLEYLPTVVNRVTGERKSLLPYFRSCLPRQSKVVHARAILKDTKVFTEWDTDKYFTGMAGDYIAASADNFNDIYIINRDIFGKTYEVL